MRKTTPLVCSFSFLFGLASIVSCATTGDGGSPAPNSDAPAEASDKNAEPTTSNTGSDDGDARSEADRALDAGRKPDALMSFIGLREGMRVADLGAGGGYTTELLARAVGKTGVVYGQNSKYIIERFAEKPWSERLAKPVMANVTRVDREFDAPLPDDAVDLDVVVMVLFYHDTVWMETDRAQMNKAIFAALKPGGSFVVVDHSGRDGTGVSEVKTLHRIEEKVVREEILAAGFASVESAEFLRNPADTRDWNDAPSAALDRRGTSDRFVLKFVKP